MKNGRAKRRGGGRSFLLFKDTGAEEGTRTPTPLRVHGPEPCASANSATSASDFHSTASLAGRRQEEQLSILQRVLALSNGSDVWKKITRDNPLRDRSRAYNCRAQLGLRAGFSHGECIEAASRSGQPFARAGP